MMQTGAPAFTTFYAHGCIMIHECALETLHTMTYRALASCGQTVANCTGGFYTVLLSGFKASINLVQQFELEIQVLFTRGALSF